MKKPIINVDEIHVQPRPPQFAAKGPAAERFDVKSGMVAAVIGAQRLGYNITAVPPGMRAYPFHNHRINEEMFFILEGKGEVRIGESTYPIRAGDIIACPPGGKETAHQIINTSTQELKYLAVSTKLSPEICDYPDSGKFGIMSEGPQPFRFVGREDRGVDYWDGE
jgi:uncharacterized cupin superfamily protein